MNFNENASSIVEIANLFEKQRNGMHRFASWDYCYGLAQCMYARKKDLTDLDYDYMALNLAFYLASWGMYRGSSFLLDKSYKIHIKPVKLIFSKDELWKGSLSSSELTAFGKELANVYGVGDKVRASNDGISGNMTDTLFTKILLGLTGNVIAYDRYCKTALSSLGFGKNFFRTNRDTSWDRLRNDGFETLADVLSDIKASYPKVEFKDSRYVQTSEYVPYPDAKNVDMFLFVLGGICDAVECISNTKSKESKKKVGKAFLLNCFKKGLSLDNAVLRAVIEEKKGNIEEIKEIYDSLNG